MTELDKKVKQYYSEWWENPKDIRNVVFESLNDYVRQRIPLGYDKKALDIGSGHGRIVSYLVEKGYQVTAVEFNRDFVNELRGRFPGVEVIEEDVRNLKLNNRYDVTTCIELIQNLPESDLCQLLAKLAKNTRLLLINMSNKQSMHGSWANFRHFREEFVFGYTPAELDNHLESAGFKVVHKRGIGLVTPVSLFRNFRGKLIPVGLAKIVNGLDPYFTRVCHLYYVEAMSNKFKE